MHEVRTKVGKYIFSSQYTSPAGYNPPVVGTLTLNQDSERIGVPVDDWRSKIARGKSATSAFFGSQNTYRSRQTNASGLATRKSDGKVASVTFSGHYIRVTSVPNPHPNTILTTTANNQALSNFVSRAISTQRSTQGGVFVGEIKEAVELITHPAKALRQGLDKFLRSSIKTAQKASRRRLGKSAVPSRVLKDKNIRKALSDTWLEQAFGWNPLMADIRDGAKGLARLVNNDYPPRKTVSGTGHDDILKSEVLNSSSVGIWTFTWFVRTSTKCDVRFVGSVITGSARSSPLREFGFMPSDFFPTVWELIPWSFVADYFTNIGDMIQNASFGTSNLAWICRTERRLTSAITHSPKLVMNSPLTFDDLGVGLLPGNGRFTRKEVVRDIYTGTFVPDFQFEIPGLGTKWINLGALAASSRRSSRAIRRL